VKIKILGDAKSLIVYLAKQQRHTYENHRASGLVQFLNPVV
jgi:hypothetical protein